ncbi:MAG: GNAT family N-acetyltransferase [Candidatus Hydrogenedentes bacterium]|nr:GNAT family N-acetyltransferase [Candidatus Hydrogenedentota bacterium]
MHFIDTEHLRLVLIDLPLFDACLAGDKEGVMAYGGFEVADEWLAESDYIQMRRGQLAANPAYGPWCVRAIVLKDTNKMVGQIGFHAPPGSADLEKFAPGGIEYGYRIYPPFRGRGYAKEAARGLMDWAIGEGVTSFVVSIRPNNAPSQAIARSLGFVKVGEQIDEVDGLEEVFLSHASSIQARLDC